MAYAQGNNTLILGLGNTLRGDDAVGIYVTSALEKKFDNLVKDVEELAEMDMALAPAERRRFGVVVGARPWMFVPEIINKHGRRRK